MLALCVSAFAEPIGFYVGGNAGLIIPRDSTFKNSGSGDETVTFHNGYSISALSGYKFKNNFRLEGEFGYKNAKTHNVETSGNPTRGYSSTVSVANLMANAFYDVKTPLTLGVTPYLGGGIGLAALMTTSGSVSGVGKTIDRSEDAVFAYQIGGGVAYDITSKVTLDLGYRFFDTTEGSLNTSGSTRSKADFTSHNILLGVRYNF
jgi:opacity protein-like surface antigen